MQFVCNRKQLSDALAINLRAIKSHSPLPVLQCVRLTTYEGVERIDLYTTDYETAIYTAVPANYVVVAEDSAALPAKRLAEIVNSMPGEQISFKMSDAGNMVIRSDRSMARLQSVPPEDMVSLPPVDDDLGLVIPQDLLHYLLSKVYYACSKNSERLILRGANFVCRDTYIEFAATDGHILSVYRQEFDTCMVRDFSVIVGRDVIGDLLKLLNEKSNPDITIKVDDDEISFHSEGGFLLIARLINGPYCNYSRFMPTEINTTITADRISLIEAFKRLEIMAQGDGHRILCSTKGDLLEMRAQSLGEGDSEDVIHIEVEGAPIRCCFHSQQVIPVLSAFDCDDVLIRFSSPLAPVLFQPSNSEDYYAVVMPLWEAGSE